MSISKRGTERGRPFKSMGCHDKFLSRITKSLYYGKLPKTARLSLPVSELASELFSEVHEGHSLNLLYCDDVASISQNTCVSPCSFVLALLYLERLKTCNAEYLRCVAPSKLFLISLMISSKYLHDDGEDGEVLTGEWARSGDISVSEICLLEKEFLNAIDWNIFVHDSVFWERLEKLEADIALREGTKRGWFTYTELNYLITCDIQNLINTLITMSAVFAATYAAGVLTLAGSVFIASKLPGTSLNLGISSNNENPTRISILPSTKYENIVNGSSEMNISIPVSVGNFQNQICKKSASTVLNTSLILVSFLVCNDKTLISEKNDYCLDSNVNSTWDWWNNPLMNWLAETSKSNKFVNTFTLPQNYYKNFAHDKLVDMTIASQKFIYLENKIHKATKLRLQEQMERSWHEEWTDTIFTTIQYLNFVSVY